MSKDNSSLIPAKRPPTVRELLSNTGGLAYPFWNGNLLRFEQEKQRLPMDKATLRPFVSEPGTRWEYGPGTDVLGQVVEKVSGLTLEDYFRKHIFAPLGMDDTFYQVPANKWDRAVRIFHKRQPDGSLVAEGSREESLVPPKVTQFHGDRGLRSTGPDYLRLIQAFLNDGELDGVRILKSETVDLMCQNHIGDLRAGEMVSVVSQISNDVHFFPGENKFGLGFLINAEAVLGGRATGSLMWAGAANTYFWIDRKQGIGGVVMTQLGPFGDATVLKLVDAYEKAIYAISR